MAFEGKYLKKHGTKDHCFFVWTVALASRPDLSPYDPNTKQFLIDGSTERVVEKGEDPEAVAKAKELLARLEAEEAARIEALKNGTAIYAELDTTESPVDEAPMEEAPSEITEANKETLIIGAIKELDPSNPEHFTKGNAQRPSKPQVEALISALGFDVTGAERDAAWAAYQEEA